MNCIVWFNGPSAKKLHNIDKKFTEIGCNHIRKDRAVDYVCVYDPRTKSERARKKATKQQYKKKKLSSLSCPILKRTIRT